jgi:hypothetical protein
MGKQTKTDGNAEKSNPDRLTPDDVERLFGEGYREIEILPDGTLRETVHGRGAEDETVTRSLKTERTWY